MREQDHIHIQTRYMSASRKLSEAMDRLCRAPWIIVVVIIFAFIPGLTGKNSYAAAQDFPSAQPDVALVSQTPVGESAEPFDQSDPGDQQQSASADAMGDATTQSSSQSQPNQQRSGRLVHDFVGDFFHDEYRIWTGPFRAQSYDSHVMKKYGLPFLIISGAMIATDAHTAHWFANSNNQVVWAGRVSQIGAPYTVAGFSAATYLIGRATSNRHVQETGFLSLEAVAESEFITLVIKEITQRERPIQGSRHIGFWEGGTSFPSGHASGSFAVAAVFAYEYRDHIAIPIAAYTLASMVDVSRMGARQHWLSDLFVGSAVGFLTGRYVYKQHHDNSLPGSLTSRLRPQLAAREHGVGLYWDF